MSPMPENQWIVQEVQVPEGLDAKGVDAFLKQIVQALKKSDHDLRIQRERPAKDAPPAPQESPGMQPLYICHNKGL